MIKAYDRPFIKEPGLKDCHPSIGEIEDAFRMFCQRLAQYQEDVHRPAGDVFHMSPETAVRLALAEVWRQARIFQRDGHTLERRATQ